MNKYQSFLIIPLILFVFSCSAGVEMQRTVISSGYDFRQYTEKGFLFTPEAYFGEYESVGVLDIEISPEVKEVNYEGDEVDNENKWIFLRSTNDGSLWKVQRVSPQEVLDEFYKEAIKMGADAVIRLSFDNIEESNDEFTYYGLSATGFAIKRIEVKDYN